MADTDRKSKSKRPKRRSGVEIAAQAREDLAEMTGLEAEAVTALEQGEDGTWWVTIDLLELSRIPETDDMLGSYEVEVDQGGKLLSYRRTRRYTRSQVDQGLKQWRTAKRAAEDSRHAARVALLRLPREATTSRMSSSECSTRAS
jgi:Gas vesicle synthesis protein GvpO